MDQDFINLIFFFKLRILISGHHIFKKCVHIRYVGRNICDSVCMSQWSVDN